MFGYDDRGVSVPVGNERYKSPSSSSLAAIIGVPMRHWKSRSKSQSRIALESKCNWTIEGQGRWRNSHGQLVFIRDSSLLNTSEVERLALQRLALTRLQQLCLGCFIEVPKVENAPSQQVKKRTILLRKKAVTTNFFESKEKDKGSSTSTAVFGVPLDQCIASDRMVTVTDNSRRHRQQSDHCEEVLSALRIPSREGSPTQVQLVSSMMSQRVGVSRGSLSDIFPGELQVPLIVQACIRFLEERGLQTLGIFRVSGSQKRVRQLREDLDKSRISLFDDSTQPHDVAQLLKEYFRDLPEPLLTRTLYRPCLEVQKIANFERKLKATRWLMYLLPTSHRDTLSTLLNFLLKVSRYAEDMQRPDDTWASGNKMDCNNLATVFGPNLLRMSKASSDSPYVVTSMERAHDRSDIILAVRFLIEQCSELFLIPSEDIDAIYQQFMIDDPDLLNAMLTRRLDNQKYMEFSERGSSTGSLNSFKLRNLNLKDTFTTSSKDKPVALDNQKTAGGSGGPSAHWDVESIRRPTVMAADMPKLLDYHKEKAIENWIVSDRCSSGGLSEEHLHPYSVAASFTITMAGKSPHKIAAISPQRNYDDYQEQQLPTKSRRVPYGKLRHMTTPTYYTEEIISTVTVPSPRNVSVTSGTGGYVYEGLSTWDTNRSKGSSEALKPRSPLERQARLRSKVYDQRNLPLTPERWKRQEIIASEHTQI